jgi:hypothetical protein
MMGSFLVGRKVRCHNGAVDFVQRDEADSSLTLAGFTGCEWLGMTGGWMEGLYRSAEALRHPELFRWEFIFLLRLSRR